MADEKKKKELGDGRHASAIKRQRQNEKRRARNRTQRSKIRTAIKALVAAPNAETLKGVIPLLDKAVNKGLLPRRRVSRMTSRLTKLVRKNSSTTVGG